jgi:hypothetical protein
MKSSSPNLRPDLVLGFRFPLWRSSVYLSVLCGKGFAFLCQREA